MFCHKCGAQIAEGAAFCHRCGTKVVYAGTAPQPADPPVHTHEPTVTSSPTAAAATNPLLQAPGVLIQASVPINVSGHSGNSFKAFVDSHVRATTSFQSTEELLESKPMGFVWIVFGVLSLIGLVLGSVNIGGLAGALTGVLVFGGFFGYATVFIISGVIRGQYRAKYSGKVDCIIDPDDFQMFLNTHLKSVSSYFHECGYLNKRGGLLTTVEKMVSNTLQEVTLCCVLGANEKNVATITIRPDTAAPGSGGMRYFVGAVRRGFLIDGRAASFLGHTCLIRTAPIMQAAMLYYINTQK